MIEPINTAARDVEDSSEADGSAKPEHRKAAAGGPSGEAGKAQNPADASKSWHEKYMFGDIHVFVD